jgi:hypothetical protein
MVVWLKISNDILREHSGMNSKHSYSTTMRSTTKYLSIMIFCCTSHGRVRILQVRTTMLPQITILDFQSDVKSQNLDFHQQQRMDYFELIVPTIYKDTNMLRNERNMLNNLQDKSIT